MFCLGASYRGPKKARYFVTLILVGQRGTAAPQKNSLLAPSAGLTSSALFLITYRVVGSSIRRRDARASFARYSKPWTCHSVVVLVHETRSWTCSGWDAYPRLRPKISAPRRAPRSLRCRAGHGASAAQRARAAQGRFAGRLPVLNRLALCRRQKRRRHRTAVTGPEAIRVQCALRRSGKNGASPRHRANPHPCRGLRRTLRLVAPSLLRTATSRTYRGNHLGERPRAFQPHLWSYRGRLLGGPFLPSARTTRQR